MNPRTLLITKVKIVNPNIKINKAFSLVGLTLDQTPNSNSTQSNAGHFYERK